MCLTVSNQISYHNRQQNEMENQLEIVIMKKTIWLLDIILVIFLPKMMCKTYKNSITLNTTPDSRQYVAKHDRDTGGWIVRVLDKGGYFVCGGSYIAPLVVVTSADCMIAYRSDLEGFIAESHKMLKHEDNFAPVTNLYIPDEYHHGKNRMDVAVLRLDYPIEGKKTQFIKLCSTPITANMKMSSFGWGYGAANVKSISLRTLKTRVSTIDMAVCAMGWATDNNVTLSNTVFCVQYNKDDPTKCLYDPGCPLVHDNQLCGIVSHAASCNNPQLPAIYTDVNKVKDFIVHTMGEIQKTAGKSSNLNRL